MEKICLDFETAFDFLRGDLSVAVKLRNYASSEEICITSFAMAQLMMAITNTEAVRPFLNSVNVLPFDRNAAHIAANLARELQNAGDDQKRLDTIMTAAICISNKAHLFTRSPSSSPSRYDGIKGLKKV
jgi:predicted nucleic acid-binding protein